MSLDKILPRGSKRREILKKIYMKCFSRYSEEERIYLDKMKKGDEEARNILIERNLRLVAHVAKKYSSTNVEQEDLISIGSIGLIKGINSFNIEKNFKLATYIAKCIENEILMYLRSNKKRMGDVYLNEPIGKDKDDNEVTLQEVIENNERNVEDEVDLKLKVKKMYEKMKDILKKRERVIIELVTASDTAVLISASSSIVISFPFPKALIS